MTERNSCWAARQLEHNFFAFGGAVTGSQLTNLCEGTVQNRQVSTSRLTPIPNRLAISLACAAVVCASAFAIQTAHAQSTGANQVSSLEAQAPYDAQTLQSFASAASTVLALRNSYYPRIRAAEIAGSNDKADFLFKEMRKHMHSAIGNSGFSADQYRAISDAATRRS